VTLCALCGRPFTPAEWEGRHGQPRTGADLHAACCERAGCPADSDDVTLMISDGPSISRRPVY
jgi:hypothetical protein